MTEWADAGMSVIVNLSESNYEYECKYKFEWGFKSD